MAKKEAISAGRLEAPRRQSRFLWMMLVLAAAGLACAVGAGSGAEPDLGAQPPAEEPAIPLATAAIMPTDGLPNPEFEDTTSGEVPEGEPSPDSEPIALIPERRLLSFEWPNQIRTGDSDVIRIVLEVDESGQLTPTAFFDEHELTTQAVEIDNLYATHLITAEARLDMAGLAVQPSGTVSKRLFPGETVDFSWSVSPTSDGSYRGTVWLFLKFVPFEEGEELEKVLFSRPLEIQTVNLFGLGGQPARVLGALGTAVGSLLGLDDIFKWLRRLRRNR